MLGVCSEVKGLRQRDMERFKNLVKLVKVHRGSRFT